MANDDVQRLLLQIDASATLLRQEVAKARTDIDGFADRSERKLSGLDRSFQGMGAAAGAAATKIAGMAAAFLSVGQAASFLVRANADFQRLSAQLEVATGSTQRASMAMSELQKFAAETPFTLNQVVEGFIRLKNLGLDPSVEAMRSFGNTSAAMGKDVMQFIEAVADAATGEFERLKEFGIKASKEGDKVKFTFQGVTTTVQNSAEAITSYLKSLGDESGAFAGSMAKQMETIDGKISNLEDAASRLATAIGGLGFSDFFMGQLDKMSRILNGAAGILSSQGFRGLLAGGLQGVAEAGTPQGLRSQMIGRVNEARAGVIEAERTRVLGRPQPQMVAQAKAVFDARYRELIAFERANPSLADPMMRFALNDNGRFGAAPKPRSAPSSTPGKAKTKRTGRAAPKQDSFTLAADEYGWAALMNDGTPANIELANEALQGVAETMRELANYDFQINPIGQEQIALAEDYTRTLTEGLAQAVVYGRNFGDVLKGLAQQIVASGLINILSGGKLGTSFGSALGGLGKIFGGFRAAGGPVSPGKAYVVGEKGPEIMVPKASGFIVPNGAKVDGGSTAPQQVTVTVQPSPLFITSVASATQTAASDALRRASRPRMMGSVGA